MLAWSPLEISNSAQPQLSKNLAQPNLFQWLGWAKFLESWGWEFEIPNGLHATMFKFQNPILCYMSKQFVANCWNMLAWSPFEISNSVQPQLPKNLAVLKKWLNPEYEVHVGRAPFFSKIYEPLFQKKWCFFSQKMTIFGKNIENLGHRLGSICEVKQKS